MVTGLSQRIKNRDFFFFKFRYFLFCRLLLLTLVGSDRGVNNSSQRDDTKVATGDSPEKNGHYGHEYSHTYVKFNGECERKSALKFTRPFTERNIIKICKVIFFSL